jgi:tetratricopeptide (TPR) repeat protein
MRRWLRIFVYCFPLVGLALQATATENTKLFFDGISRYQAGQYEEAAAAFIAITESGVQNGKLYYNIGNAFFKQNDLGRAILWYERARKKIAGDPDLDFNLNYARSFRKDEAVEEVAPLYRVLFFWYHLLSHRIIVACALTANLFFWLILLIYRLRPRYGLKVAAYPIGFIALLFSLTSTYCFHDERTKRAIVLPETLSVRSGLSDEATELFVLHAGTRVRVANQRKGYYLIHFADGKIGWVRAKSVGII